MAEEKKTASIDELVEEGLHPRHGREGGRIKDVVLDLRVPLLLKHYKNSIPDAERARFEQLSEQEQIEKLREKNYILPKEHANAFVRDMAVYVTKQHDENLGKMLEDNFKTYYEDETADHHKKAKALKFLNDFKPMLERWNFNWDRLEREGAESGFDRDLFFKHAGRVDQGYTNAWQEGYLTQAKEEDVNKYLEKIGGDVPGFKVDIAKGKTYDEKIGVIAGYAQSKKVKDIKGFKESYQKYFKEDKK